MTEAEHTQRRFWSRTGLGDIAVGIDGSDASRGASRWAADLAHVTNARIRLVHALQQHLSHADTDREKSDSENRVAGRRLLRSARAEIHGIDPDVVVDSILSGSPIARFLGSVSQTADLAVIGGHRSGPLSDVLFGYKATRIVAESECPVVVWRPHSAAASRRPAVVVGVDDSESCTRAIDGAFWFAHTLGLPLTAIHLDSHHRGPNAGHDRPPLDRLEKRIAPAASRFTDVTVHLHCIESSAEHALVRASASAQLVVVGSRGLGPITGPLLGSIGQSLVHSSHCPVLVVH